MDSWKIEIEESAKLISRGILCLISVNGKKLYVKVKSHKNDFIELIPLTKSEMVENSIQESDLTVNNSFDVDIQESEKTPQEEACDKAYEAAKKKQSFNLLDPEQARKARELADAAVKIANSKNPEEIQAENEDLRGKLELIASRELEKKMDSLGITDETTREKIRESPERITGYSLATAKYYPQNSEIPSGNAPLNSQQTGISNELTKMEFENPIQMVRYLREKAKTDPQARLILDAMFVKGLKGQDRSGESQGQTLKDLRKKGKNLRSR
jgi:hypothetical protein